MQYRPLGCTGLDVSVPSFGASSFGGVFRAIKLDECIEIVHAALDGSINFIDVSPAYGGTRAERVFDRALDGVDCDRSYLASKVGSYGAARGDYDFSRASTKRSVEHSVVRLGVDDVNLIQCRDIEFAAHDQVVYETLPTLQRPKEQALVRHIGITDLPLKVFPSIFGRVEPGAVETILSFCHYKLNGTSLTKLLPYFEEKGVGVINAASTAIQEVCWKTAAQCRGRGADIVKLAVQFSCANPDIATTLVGTARPDNIRDDIVCLN